MVWPASVMGVALSHFLRDEGPAAVWNPQHDAKLEALISTRLSHWFASRHKARSHAKKRAHMELGDHALQRPSQPKDVVSDDDIRHLRTRAANVRAAAVAYFKRACASPLSFSSIEVRMPGASASSELQLVTALELADPDEMWMLGAS